VRQLYSDRDEVLFDAARPVILNGIEDIVTALISPISLSMALLSSRSAGLA
jgi:hypothetical protein